MKNQVRFDFSQARKPVITEQGYLQADVTPTRSGLLTYIGKDGQIVRELRLDEEVFAKESLDSLKHIVVTDEHPPELLSPENTSKYSKGFTHDDVRRDGDYVAVTATVTEKKLIEKIMEGQREVSLGYTCQVEPVEPGSTYQGLEYHGIQRRIRYNHLASVKRGRAGPFATFRLDSMSQVIADEMTEHKEKSKMLIELNGVSYEVQDANLAKAIVEKVRKDEADIKAAESASNELKTRIDSLSKEIDSLKGVKDGLEVKLKELQAVERKDSAEDLHKAVVARQKLYSQAGGILDEEVKLDSMSNSEIIKAVVLKKMPHLEERKDSLSEAYLEGVFDTIIQSNETESVRELADVVVKTDSAPASSDDARARMIEESKKMHLS